MVKKSFNIDVEPKVVRWAIKSSGYSIEELSKKIRISENTINGWIEGRKQPTLQQVENLSKHLKMPLAVFFLPKPPEEKPLPKDYRMLPGKEGIFDKKTILAIRTARRLQKVSKELSENLHRGLKPDISPVNLVSNPQEIAKNYRDMFQITEDIQKKWKTSYEAFNTLKELIEKRNIFVFQTSMPIEDARGFTLADDTPPVIVINSKDQIEARIFSLVHEFAHVLLNKSGIDMPENFNNSDKVERWCNEFAAAFLLPADAFTKTKNKENLTETKTLDYLSKRYNVSKHMILYNMHKLNYITHTQYKEVLERYKQLQKESGEKKKKKGGSLPDRRCISEKGKKLISLVSANVENNFITNKDALDYLSIKSKHYDKILAKIKE
ncbi:MAG: transcription factor [Candidatus Methanolliviera sp. GoM_oil]|nr:MAG: transcription factor [Candidatus Methanolliviera sp. GoM_oil]